MQPFRELYLLYHELRPDNSPYTYALQTTEFENQVDLFAQLQRDGSTTLRPQLTFDDGHISNFEFALPILRSRGLAARFFITVGWTGRKKGFMNWPHLKELLQGGQQIGAHGWSHTLLTHCTEKQLVTELNTARLTLEDKLGVPITTMSLPGGRYNQRVLDACWTAGYTHIFTSIPRAEPYPIGPILGRLNIRGDMSLEWIAKLFQPGNPFLIVLERQYRIKSAAKTLIGDRLYEKLWVILNRKETDPNPEEAAASEDSTHHQ
jgi:hypothetical protein